MSMTLAELQARYSPRWVIHEGYVYWLAVRSCGQQCPNPEHASRHILFGHDPDELAALLESTHMSP